MLIFYKKTGNKTPIDIVNGLVEDSDKVSPIEFVKDLVNSFGVGAEQIWLLEIQPWLYHSGLRLDQIHRVTRCKFGVAKIYEVSEIISFTLSVIEYIQKHYEIVRL